MCSELRYIDFVHNILYYIVLILSLLLYTHITRVLCMHNINTRDKRMVSNFVKELWD